MSYNGSSRRRTPPSGGRARATWERLYGEAGILSRARRFGGECPEDRPYAFSSDPLREELRKPRPVPESPLSLASLYTLQDLITDTIARVMLKQGTYIKWLPELITEYLPIYSWTCPQRIWKAVTEKEQDFMRVTLSHCQTIAVNDQQKFGAVMGTFLDPRVDHVISVKLVEGVEFGVGICDGKQMREHATKRDFMCQDGGFGYYNYKTKSPRMKPKYPPGLYCQTNDPCKIRDEKEIVREGDVLTMVIQRQDVPVDVPGGGLANNSRLGQEGCSQRMPTTSTVKTLRPGLDRMVSLSFYLNGKCMNFHLINLKPESDGFYLCLNYYFVESTIRILSDYKFPSGHRRTRSSSRLRSAVSKESAPASLRPRRNRMML